MSKLFRGLIYLLLLTAIFGVGFYFGRSGTQEIKRRYTALKEEMLVKTGGLESEISLMRVRLNIFEARHFLGSARTDVDNNNFGEAGVKVEKARERIDRAISLSPDSMGKELISFQAEINAIQDGLQDFSPQVGAQIGAMEKALEKIAE
ncbi:MAG: hypothetical protein ACE5J1_04975 [Nitrospiria bacterium]